MSGSFYENSSVYVALASETTLLAQVTAEAAIATSAATAAAASAAIASAAAATLAPALLNTTDASSLLVAGAVFAGGVAVTKQLRVGGLVTLSAALNAAGTITGNSLVSVGGLLVSTSHIAIDYQASGGDGFVRVYKGDGVTGLSLGGTVSPINTYNNTTHKFFDAASSVQFAGLNATALSVLPSTVSSSTSTGALVVSGGVGIAGAANIGGAVSITSATASTTTSTGALIVTGGAGIAGAANIGGITKVSSGTAASSTTTGALVVTGGVGVSGSLYAGLSTVAPTYLTSSAANVVAALDGTSTIIPVTAGSTVDIVGFSSGLLLLTDSTFSGASSAFLIGGGAVALLGQSSATTFVATSSPTASQWGVFYNAGTTTYRIKNGSASTASLYAMLLRLRPST